jgi:hypothetical protein
VDSLCEELRCYHDRSGEEWPEETPKKATATAEATVLNELKEELQRNADRQVDVQAQYLVQRTISESTFVPPPRVSTSSRPTNSNSLLNRSTRFLLLSPSSWRCFAAVIHVSWSSYSSTRMMQI